jgi:hypothetical protein
MSLTVVRQHRLARMLQQGIQLLDRFAQDDHFRVRQPTKNLQLKFPHSLPSTVASPKRHTLEGPETLLGIQSGADSPFINRN